jgi:hypothetical protein
MNMNDKRECGQCDWKQRTQRVMKLVLSVEAHSATETHRQTILIFKRSAAGLCCPTFIAKQHQRFLIILRIITVISKIVWVEFTGYHVARAVIHLVTLWKIKRIFNRIAVKQIPISNVYLFSTQCIFFIHSANKRRWISGIYYDIRTANALLFTFRVLFMVYYQYS